MKDLTIDAIVIKYVDYKDNDRILTLFSPEHGKITCIAPGCKKPKSRFFAASQLFCYGNFVLRSSKSMYYLNSAAIQNTFYDLRADMMKMSFGSYCLELMNKIIQPQENSKDLFYLLLSTLAQLTFTKNFPGDIVLCFEAKVLMYLGIYPVYNRCVICKRTDNLKYISTINGGVVCQDCHISEQSVDENLLYFLEAIITQDIKNISSIHFSPRMFYLAHNFFKEYIKNHLEIEMLSEQVIETLLPENRRA